MSTNLLLAVVWQLLLKDIVLSAESIHNLNVFYVNQIKYGGPESKYIHAH